MSKRKRARREDMETARPAREAAGGDAWDTPGFRTSLLIDLAFVAAPAIIMAVLGEYLFAAGWFGLGVLVLAWQFWRQIRSFWRSFRSVGQAGREE